MIIGACLVGQKMDPFIVHQKKWDPSSGTSSVTRFGKIPPPLCQNFKLFGNFSGFVFGKFLNLIWPTFMLLWQFFVLTKGQILTKLSSQLVTLHACPIENAEKASKILRAIFTELDSLSKRSFIVPRTSVQYFY